MVKCLCRSCVLVVATLATSAYSSRFANEVNAAKAGNKARFCCSDYYAEPTNLATYGADVETNKKMSCSSPVDTEKCGMIVPTRNSHSYGIHHGGVHCIESHSCLECIEHFQILCGPGYTWDGHRCSWIIDVPHAMSYDQGTNIKGSHGETSCIVLDSHGYALKSTLNNPMKDDCSSGYCYNARDNVNMQGLSSSMVGETELTSMGLTWTGVTHEQVNEAYPTRFPTVAHPPTQSLPPSPPPTPWENKYIQTQQVSHVRLRELLTAGFCCSRMFESGIIGRPKEIFMEGKEYLNGTDTNSQMINMGIADGSLAIMRRRQLAYKSAGEIPTFSEMFFGAHMGCGHSPPVDSECGRVVDPHGLDLQHEDMHQYLGGAYCGHFGGLNKCHEKVTNSISTFEDDIIPAHETASSYSELEIEYLAENRNTLDIALAAHAEEYVTKCLNEPGCGFHSDCIKLCHDDSKHIYRGAEFIEQCTGTGPDTVCQTFQIPDHPNDGVNSKIRNVVSKEYKPEWSPMGLCTKETYTPPLGQDALLSTCSADIDTCVVLTSDPEYCFNQLRECAQPGYGGDPHFGNLWRDRNLTDNCMCSMDNHEKASIDNLHCHTCLTANVIACADGYTYDAHHDRCEEGGVCSNFENECHVQTEDQLFADPVPCLSVSGHNVDYHSGETPTATDKDICESTNYTVPRACVWDRVHYKCKAGIYFGLYDPSFEETCAAVNKNEAGYPLTSPQLEWQCESTVWMETRQCQATERVAYPVTCERKYGGATIECDPDRRVIPWSPDPDDVCDVLMGKKSKDFFGPNYDEKRVMDALKHMCDWPGPSKVDKFVDWLEDLNTMEIVAFVFLMVPVLGTLLCTANSIFRWNTGCCKSCCGNIKRRKPVQRLPVAPVVKSSKAAGTSKAIVVGPMVENKAVV